MHPSGGPRRPEDFSPAQRADHEGLLRLSIESDRPGWFEISLAVAEKLVTAVILVEVPRGQQRSSTAPEVLDVMGGS
ncbi:hypothetical protein [Nocardia sp. AG03]|uniref:hypothetical protein n=1 Tax=Nocardia sp. AG03 TaxID=3025312 RepID=UPI0024184846|nr:hypothetical protein [Nocardia sp. AG03]